MWVAFTWPLLDRQVNGPVSKAQDKYNNKYNQTITVTTNGGIPLRSLKIN